MDGEDEEEDADGDEEAAAAGEMDDARRGDGVSVGRLVNTSGCVKVGLK